MFDPRFHDTDRLINTLRPGLLPYAQIGDIARAIQHEIQASPALQDYALKLWEATRRPKDFGVKLDGVDMDRLILAGASARGMSLLMRAARCVAWLSGRGYVTPEDVQSVFRETVAHRVFFTPVYEMRREAIASELIGQIVGRVAAP
jgi:MoxR-like ATPase